jgi:signal transduction histidine kinase
VRGLLGVIKDESDPEVIKDLLNKSEEASQNLLDEIDSQRQIAAAENGDLEVKTESLNTLEFLHSVTSRIKYNTVADKKNIVIDGDSADLQFRSDSNLLQRILINMLKNALEATSQGGVVKVGCYHKEGKLKFSVWNKGVIAPDIQLQIFQRSFSTKGSGRGLGTYSIKLLAERYLKGRVSFVSNTSENTKFILEFDH